jgi:ACT domain-containing protein
MKNYQTNKIITKILKITIIFLNRISKNLLLNKSLKPLSKMKENLISILFLKRTNSKASFLKITLMDFPNKKMKNLNKIYSTLQKMKILKKSNNFQANLSLNHNILAIFLILYKKISF